VLSQVLCDGAFLPGTRRGCRGIPKIATVNVHFGISPHYRGENTIFWPLYFGDYENVGFTLHYIDKGVDTGNILAQGFPALDSTDTEATIWTKCARMAAELLVDFLRQNPNTPVRGRPQESRGRLFYALDRKIWQEIHYGVRRRFLGWRPPSRAERTVKYFGPGPSPSPAPGATNLNRMLTARIEGVSWSEADEDASGLAIHSMKRRSLDLVIWVVRVVHQTRNLFGQFVMLAVGGKDAGTVNE
jgi:Formyl transferase